MVTRAADLTPCEREWVSVVANVSSAFRPLGRAVTGSFGSVQRGEVDLPTGRTLQLALKTVSPATQAEAVASADGPAALNTIPGYPRSSYLREQGAMRACHACPHTVQLFAAAESRNTDRAEYRFWMELGPGGTLLEVVRRFNERRKYATTMRKLVMPEPLARYYAACVLSALEHMHRHKMVHRDVKPANVVMGEDGRPLLADFGSSGAYGGIGAVPVFSGMVGTPLYMAPEVVAAGGSNHKYGCSADMYSFGVLLLQLVSTAPWSSELLAACTAALFGPGCPKYMPPLLVDLLSRLLSADPSQRPSAAEAMAHPWFEGIDWGALHVTPPPLACPRRFEGPPCK